MCGYTSGHWFYSMERSIFLKKFHEVSPFCDPGTVFILQIKLTK